jgi:predicted CopG family antitoxin
VGTKNISLSDDAYQRLKAMRKPGESFTDVIERMTHGAGVLELVGVLSKTEGTELKRRVREVRKASKERSLRTIEMLS